MNRGIIQSAIENKSLIMGAQLRRFSDLESKFESEEPTLADLMAPGTGRSISAEFDCLLRALLADGKR